MSKFLTRLFGSCCFALTFSFLYLSIPCSAFAEYYVVATSGACGGPCAPRPIRRPSCARPIVRPSCGPCAASSPCGSCRRPGVAVSYMAQAPACGIRTPQPSCGWYPNDWVGNNYELLQSNDVFFPTAYDPDLATADDDQFAYPDMDIDE